MLGRPVHHRFFSPEASNLPGASGQLAVTKMYLSKQRLDGKVAFVTGAGRGIGFAASEALLEAGARVVLADLEEDRLNQAVKALREKGGECHGVVLDVADPQAVERAAIEARREFGRVGILVANAGITWPDTPGEAIPDAAWRKIIDVDLNGVYWTCREFGKFMLEQGSGAIVTMGSISGVVSNKPQRQAHYNAAKAAVHHLTRSLAGEWAERGVRVNCVAPTYVNTPMSSSSFTDPDRFPTWMDCTPMRRVARPDEVASAILFLASDASSAITGTTLMVDCGYTIW